MSGFYLLTIQSFIKPLELIITIWYLKIYLISFRGTISEENTGIDKKNRQITQTMWQWETIETLVFQWFWNFDNFFFFF